MLYGTFIRTTDPDTEFAQLVAPDVFFSLFLHTLIYFAAYLTIVKLFDLPYSPPSPFSPESSSSCASASPASMASGLTTKIRQ